MQNVIKNIKNSFTSHLINIPGWHTNRKIVVFESDDWGSIRTPSREVLTKLNNIGLRTEKCHYALYDTLASEDDLKSLFSLLRSYTDSNGRHPVITANAIMANPDFDKIRESKFSEYFYEIFTETLSKYPNHKDSFQLWQLGITEGFFYPQFHGREHLHVMRWLKCLQNDKSITRKIFNLYMFGLSTSVTPEDRKSFMSAYDWDDNSNKDFILNSVKDGLEIFERTFNFKSKSSIAPNYIWHPEVEDVLKSAKVDFIQGRSVQVVPSGDGKENNIIRHYTGQRNLNNQFYLVRNCRFEPSSNKKVNWVENCIDDIGRSFLWKKPAIVDVHRVNFIGSIDEENRSENLKLFRQLLDGIIRNWPEVEFMNTVELGNEISRDEK